MEEKNEKINVELDNKSAFNEAFERKMGEFKAGCLISFIKFIIILAIITFFLIIASL